MTANLWSQVYSNVQIEPHLQPLSGETLSHRTSNSDDQARLDISAKGFWNTSHELAFFDVRVLFPWLRVTLISHSPLASVSMRKEFAILSMELLHHLCFLLLVAWDPSQLHFTDVWPPYCLTNYISPTIRRFAGFVAT